MVPQKPWHFCFQVWFHFLDAKSCIKLESNCSMTRDLKWAGLIKSPLLCEHFTQVQMPPECLKWFICWSCPLHPFLQVLHSKSFISFGSLFLPLCWKYYLLTLIELNRITTELIAPGFVHLLPCELPPVPIVSRPSIKITCSGCRIALLSPMERGLQMKGEWHTVQ